MTNETKNVPELRFPEFDGEWEEKKIGELSQKTISGGTPRTSKLEFWNGDIPWIQSSDLSMNKLYIDSSNKSITEEAIDNSSAKIIPAKSIAIVTRVGVGKLAFVDFKYSTSQDFISLANLTFDTNFSIYSLYNKIKIISKNLQGTSIKGITKNELLNTVLLMPLDIVEQHKIGEFFSKLDRQIELEEQKLEKLEEQKKGYMQKIFSQELRFKDENGNDHPEWGENTLGEITNITTGSLDANAMVANGKYKFFTCAREPYQIDNYAFDTEALLISGNGANVGYIHHYKGKFNAYQRTYVLDRIETNIYFLKYYLEKNLIKRIYSEKRDGNTPYITRSTLYDMEINIPISNQEQQKIGDFFKKVDELIETQFSKVELLKERKKGFLQKMFV